MMKKGIIDLISFLSIALPLLVIAIAIYFSFQSLEKPLIEMIKENSQRIIMVTPSKTGCQVSIVRQ